MGEEVCISEEVKGASPVPYSDVRRRVLEIFRKPVPLAKGVKKKGMVKHLIKVDRVYGYIDSAVFAKVEKLPKPEELNAFYAEILKLAGITDYADILRKFRGYRRVLRKLWKEYRLKIKSTVSAREANDVAREFVGRTLSLVKRIRKDIDLLRAAIAELRKLPCFNFNEPIIVVAGMPQVGKSTFVRRVSTAEPEVSPFPFTTKDVILGHVFLDHVRVQIIDTPGILDRPLDELNEIERKAVSAVRFLGDVLLFLIDPRSSSYYSLEEQLGLLRMVRSIFRGKGMIVAVNKIDEVNDSRLEYVVKKIRKVFDGEIYLISALQGTGVDAVLRRLLELAASKYLTT